MYDNGKFVRNQRTGGLRKNTTIYNVLFLHDLARFGYRLEKNGLLPTNRGQWTS